MIKNIFLIIFLLPFLVHGQKNQDTLKKNQFNFGLTDNPLLYINTKDGYKNFRYNFGYKRRFKTKYFFRVGFNSNYKFTSRYINIGIERIKIFGKNKFKFLYGFDIVGLSDESIMAGLSLGPVMGIEYFIKPRLSLLTEFGITWGYGKRLGLPYEFRNIYYAHSQRFLGIITNYNF